MVSDTQPNVHVTLSLHSSEQQLVATLVYKNAGTNVAFIDLINGCIKGELKNDVFEIVAQVAGAPAKEPIRYKGPRLKRRQPTLPDFLRLEAGAAAEANVRLDTGYAFPAGRGTYKIVYSSVHQFPHNDDYWELTSNELTVTFPK